MATKSKADTVTKAGRKKQFGERVVLTMAPDLLARLNAVLADGEARTDAMRGAIEDMVSRREAAKASQPTRTRKPAPVAALAQSPPAAPTKPAPIRPVRVGVNTLAKLHEAKSGPSAAPLRPAPRVGGNVDRQEPRPPVRSEDEPAKMRTANPVGDVKAEVEAMLARRNRGRI